MIIEKFDMKSIPILRENQKKIILYGAGTGASSYSRIGLAALRHHRVNIAYFVDDDEKLHGSYLLGLPIFPLERVTCEDRNPIVFLTSNYFPSMFRRLEEAKVQTEIYALTELLEQTPEEAFHGVMAYQEVQRRLHTHKTKLERILASEGGRQEIVINAIDIQVTECCSMKCIDCSNLMQYYSKPVHADIEILLDSLRKLIEAVDSIGDARVLGGEPFLNRDLPRVLDFLSSTRKVDRITVYSNGTFIPREDALQSLQNEKIEVEITDYDLLSRSHNEMMGEFTRRGIRFITHKPQNWTDSARIVVNNKSDEELATLFERCCVNDAITLLHGKLYHCPFSANSHNLNAIEKDSTDWISITEIDEIEDIRKAFKGFYFKKAYQTACKFCLGRDYTQATVVPAIQTRKPIPIPVVSKQAK